ncbi:MAG: hypothetical protein HOO86_13170 [Bacteroidales bacterium]|nr:hypothetical protein [Bacteroidales bacterium]
MHTFEIELDKHRKSTDFVCVGACFADLQRIYINTKYSPHWVYSHSLAAI